MTSAAAGWQDPARREAYAEVAALADWSEWMPFDVARHGAPREPGVYLLREPLSQTVRYAGMAGERAGGGRPQGLRGRLAGYGAGSGAVSGLGEAALDRALADPAWLEAQLTSLREHGPKKAKEWAADAVDRLGLECCWAVCADRDDARYLQSRVVNLIRVHGLWNS